MLKKVCLLLSALTALTACSKKQQAQEAVEVEPMPTQSLVLYYSQEGATRQLAELVAEKTGADIDSIVAVNPYSGTFEETVARVTQEMKDSTLTPIKALTRNVADYDTIYIGYPVWCGTYARPIATLLKEQDFTGKVIIPFCTFGSGGLNTSTNDIKAALPSNEMVPGYGVRNARMKAASAELDKYLINAGIKHGQVETLPDYSAQMPINDEAKGIFHEACDSYPMPLGKPVSFASRATSEGTDYVFEAEQIDKSGMVNKSQVYVTKSNEAGAVPEFTQVVR